MAKYSKENSVSQLGVVHKHSAYLLICTSLTYICKYDKMNWIAYTWENTDSCQYFASPLLNCYQEVAHEE